MLRTIQTDVATLARRAGQINQQLQFQQIQPGTVHEVEIRFRHYDQQQYRGAISFRQFHLVQRYLDVNNIEPTITRTRDDSQSYRRERSATIRRSTNLDTQEVTWILKRRLIPHINNPNFNLRYAISQEVPINEPPGFNPENSRVKERYSYDYATMYRVDLTKVNNGASFELEVEIKEEYWNRAIAYQHLSNVITRILKVLHDTECIYTVENYNNIVSFFNRTMRGSSEQPIRRSSVINHKMLFQARNLNARDIVTGGLCNNEKYQYNVTVKADGERKLLVVHSTGVWLLMGPDQANLIFPFQEELLQKLTTNTNRDPTGTILEGELIPFTNRKEKAPNTKYWFLIFDCLSRSTNRTDIGDSSVQNLSHTDRLKWARQVKTTLELLGSVSLANGQSLLTVNIKDFKGFDSASSLFEIIREMENRKEIGYYAYQDDGYIFTANNMPYNYRDTYSGYQDIQVRWRRQNNNTWRNDQGSTIQLVNESLVENTSQEQVHMIFSSDASWYSIQSLNWNYDRDINIWTTTGGRQWLTVNPRTTNNAGLRGARSAQEVSNIIRIVEGDLWQTIKIREIGSRSVPISKIPLHMRKLTKYPDICKWKPPHQLTIDFATIRHTEGIQLLVSGFDGSLVPFTGTPHHPFITNPEEEPYGPVDINNELYQQIADRVTIVEYAWDFNAGRMIPQNIREDKTRPNSMAIANAVWSDIQNPIDISAMRGDSFLFMRKYHNRIKYRLFNETFGNE